MKYKKISPRKYAEQIKVKFLENHSLWFDVIVPKEKAEELRKKTQGDYSIIWHEHCDLCWKSIDATTDEDCYVSVDELSWLCQDCFNLLKNK